MTSSIISRIRITKFLHQFPSSTTAFFLRPHPKIPRITNPLIPYKTVNHILPLSAPIHPNHLSLRPWHPHCHSLSTFSAPDSLCPFGRRDFQKKSTAHISPSCTLHFSKENSHSPTVTTTFLTRQKLPTNEKPVTKYFLTANKHTTHKFSSQPSITMRSVQRTKFMPSRASSTSSTQSPEVQTRARDIHLDVTHGERLNWVLNSFRADNTHILIHNLPLQEKDLFRVFQYLISAGLPIDNPYTEDSPNVHADGLVGDLFSTRSTLSLLVPLLTTMPSGTPSDQVLAMHSTHTVTDIDKTALRGSGKLRQMTHTITLQPTPISKDTIFDWTCIAYFAGLNPTNQDCLPTLPLSLRCALYLLILEGPMPHLAPLVLKYVSILWRPTQVDRTGSKNNRERALITIGHLYVLGDPSSITPPEHAEDFVHHLPSLLLSAIFGVDGSDSIPYSPKHFPHIDTVCFRANSLPNPPRPSETLYPILTSYRISPHVPIAFLNLTNHPPLSLIYLRLLQCGIPPSSIIGSALHNNLVKPEASTNFQDTWAHHYTPVFFFKSSDAPAIMKAATVLADMLMDMARQHYTPALKCLAILPRNNTSLLRIALPSHTTLITSDQELTKWNNNPRKEFTLSDLSNSTPDPILASSPCAPPTRHHSPKRLRREHSPDRDTAIRELITALHQSDSVYTIALLQELLTLYQPAPPPPPPPPPLHESITRALEEYFQLDSSATLDLIKGFLMHRDPIDDADI
jgi:hypothetical protein